MFYLKPAKLDYFVKSYFLLMLAFPLALFLYFSSIQILNILFPSEPPLGVMYYSAVNPSASGVTSPITILIAKLSLAVSAIYFLSIAVYSVFGRAKFNSSVKLNLKSKSFMLGLSVFLVFLTLLPFLLTYFY